MMQREMGCLLSQGSQCPQRIQAEPHCRGGPSLVGYSQEAWLYGEGTLLGLGALASSASLPRGDPRTPWEAA